MPKIYTVIGDKIFYFEMIHGIDLVKASFYHGGKCYSHDFPLSLLGDVDFIQLPKYLDYVRDRISMRRIDNVPIAGICSTQFEIIFPAAFSSKMHPFFFHCQNVELDILRKKDEERSLRYLKFNKGRLETDCSELDNSPVFDQIKEDLIAFYSENKEAIEYIPYVNEKTTIQELYNIIDNGLSSALFQRPEFWIRALSKGGYQVQQTAFDVVSEKSGIYLKFWTSDKIAVPLGEDEIKQFLEGTDPKVDVLYFQESQHHKALAFKYVLPAYPFDF